MSNEVRPFKHHRHGGMGGEGYSAKLGRYVLDARQDPTGVALMNEHGRVNVHMVPVDLVTEDCSTVAVIGFFLAEEVYDGDELRTDYGGPCYQGVRDLKGYGYGGSTGKGSTYKGPPYFTGPEQAKLPEVLLHTFDTDSETRKAFEEVLQYAGVWEYDDDLGHDEHDQTRRVGELPRRRAHPGLQWPSQGGSVLAVEHTSEAEQQRAEQQRASRAGRAARRSLLPPPLKTQQLLMWPA